MKYSLEVLKEIKEEISPLFEKAWEEVDFLADHVELDPDWDLAIKMEEMGMFRTYTMREEGVLVGFTCVIVQPLLHSRSNFHSAVDVAYIDPSHRGSFKSFLRLIESDLKDQGVKTFSFNLKSWDKTGEFLKKEGYTHTENEYMKVVN